MPIYIPVNGEKKKVKSIFSNVNGEKKKFVGVFGNVEGAKVGMFEEEIIRVNGYMSRKNRTISFSELIGIYPAATTFSNGSLDYAVTLSRKNRTISFSELAL